MSPQIEKVHIPEGLMLQQRPVCHQQSDELPVVRTVDGRVYAQVQTWSIERAPN